MSDWQPIETAPYDEICLFYVDGHIIESFIYDGTADDMFGLTEDGRSNATHWQPLPEPPEDI